MYNGQTGQKINADIFVCPVYHQRVKKFIKDENGEVIEVHCTYDPETKSGSGFSARKVKGTLHWVSAENYINADVRLYDYLMLDQEDGTKIFKIKGLKD